MFRKKNAMAIDASRLASLPAHDACVRKADGRDLLVPREKAVIIYRMLKLDCGATVDGKLLRMGDEPAAAEAGQDAGSKIVSYAKAPQAFALARRFLDRHHGHCHRTALG